MKRICTFLMLLAFPLFMLGQQLSPEVIATAGDYYTGENGSLSWTMGEPVIETYSFREHTITQGFQQSFLYNVYLNEPVYNGVEVSIYPNPAKDYLYITVSSEDEMKKYDLVIYDLLGKIAYQAEIFSGLKSEKINISHFMSNMLTVRITNKQGQLMASAKILKVKF